MILDKLWDKKVWYEFLEYKKSNLHVAAYRLKDLLDFIENEEYLPVVQAITTGQGFSIPTLREINKKGTAKKRCVFVFNRAENYVLKLIAYLLNEYDGTFSQNLYSFRKNVSVKTAISNLIKGVNNLPQYSYKVDIHDYFNSVDKDLMIDILEQTLANDKPLKSFIISLLTEPYCLFEGQVVVRSKGIMAGVPISGFLANLYLLKLDQWFKERNITYARYSDDIIVFADSKRAIEDYEREIKQFLADKKLTVNEKKEIRTSPNQPWEFLGFSFDGKEIDISTVALQKIKDKIRRKAHALERWKDKKGAESERAIRAFIKHFNKKFFNNDKENELTWCRWYFPTVTTAKSLKIIDEYMIENVRFISTGKHTKSNYNLKYEEIKKLGYRSLVNAFYQYKAGKYQIN